MRAYTILLATWLNIFLLPVTRVAAQLPGSISGAVLNEKGSPVIQAQVRVDPLDGRPTASAVRSVESDKTGHFIARGIGFGSYKLFAVKESDGYPNTAFGFYSIHVFPTVTLTESVPTVDVILRVGPPAGVLSGLVSSAATGNPVSAAFLLRRISAPDNWISLSQKADYRVLLPPSVEISVEVSAPGYKTWYYGGPSDVEKRTPIQLESGKEMKLDIQLELEHKPEK